MKRLLLFFVCAAFAFAADVTGNWSAQIADQSGNNITINYTFKQDGTKLTGTVTGPGGDLPIQEGKVEEDKISFNVTFDGGNGAMKVGNKGTIKGEEITMTIEVNGQTFGAPVTLKKAK
jgi:hypothetical protein